MSTNFTTSYFSKRYPTDEVCLEEIRRLRFPKGMFCPQCRKATKHYKINRRTAYACKFCRDQIHPLSGTIFEKSTTPLRLWFYAIFLLTKSDGKISPKQLQKELGVTYKTAWRMKKRIIQNNEDLLSGLNEEEKVRKWFFFNKFEFKVAERKIGDEI